MYHLCYVVNPNACTPGYNERIVCHTPVMRQHVDTYKRPLVNPQTGQPIMVPDEIATFQALQQQGWLNPNLRINDVQFQILVPRQTNGLAVLCAQKTPFPQVERAQVNAVFQQPVGNPGAPNEILPEGQHGGYVPVPNSGLPNGTDPVFGDQNAYAGAYQNLEVNHGAGTIREHNDLTGMSRQSEQLTRDEYDRRAAAARVAPMLTPTPPWQGYRQP